MNTDKFLDNIKVALAAVRAMHGDFTGVVTESIKRLPMILGIIAAIFFVVIIMPIIFVQSLFVGEDAISNDSFGTFAIESLNFKENWIDSLAYIQTRRILYAEDNPDFSQVEKAIKDNALEKLLASDEKASNEAIDVFSKNKKFLNTLLKSFGGYLEFYDEIAIPSAYSSIKKEFNQETQMFQITGLSQSIQNAQRSAIYSGNDVVNFKIDTKAGKIKIKYRKYVIKAFFPVHGDYKESFSDDFGGGRINNGEQQSHEGIDIFANRNAPLLAIEDCTIQKIGWNGLGGWRILLQSKDGNKVYYYAHMERYSDKLSKYQNMNGEIFQNPPEDIKCGEIIGYVGSSGSFSSNTPPGADTYTSPHLHFQIWVKGGDWYSPNLTLINPYFVLKLLETNKYNQSYINNIERIKMEGL